jgi:hypothetical protein
VNKGIIVPEERRKLGDFGMTEEPKQQNRNAEGNGQINTPWSQVKDFFSKNPTFGTTLLYIYVTGVGIVYSAVLYGRFGINIFDYSEIGDFLLAAFKNPIAFLSAGLFAAVAAVVLRLMARELRNWDKAAYAPLSPPEPGQTMEEHTQSVKEEAKREVRKVMGLLTIGLVLVGIFSSLMLPYFSAARTASSIKKAKSPMVDVRYRASSGATDQVTKSSLEHIGATQTTAFFYDEDDKRTIVIPQAQIVSIEIPE